MQAIILAAGLGTRLRPLTDKVPKALTEIGNKTLLSNMLDILDEYGIHDVIIVVGYLGDIIKFNIGQQYKDIHITYVENEIYKDTNNNYSLYKAKDFIREDVLLLESDLFCPKEAIRSLIHSKADCSILVSKYNPDTMDGTVVYTDIDNNVYKMVLKENQGLEPITDNALKTVNIYKFSYDFWTKKFMPELEIYLKYHDKKSYYEKVLGTIIYYRNSNIIAILISENLWAEVDDLKDLEVAEKKFCNK